MFRRLLLVLSLLVPLYANHINWMGSYEVALNRAKSEHKPLMVLLVEKNCKSCKEIIAKIFMNKPYINRLNREVVSVIVTKESQMPYPIELFYSTDFPTLFFVNSEDEVFIVEPFYGDVTSMDIEKVLETM